MPRLRKLRRKQKYQYNVNRRNLNKKMNKLPTIQCEAIRKAWNDKKGVNENLTSMGLVADTNQTKSFRIPSGRQQLMPAKDIDETAAVADTEPAAEPKFISVKIELEKEAKEAYKDKKSVAHPLPPEMYKKLTQFIDRYGEDYEAMASDYCNYNQETPAQLRAQINRLKKIPQQWTKYLKSRGLIPRPEDQTTTVQADELPTTADSASSD